MVRSAPLSALAAFGLLIGSLAPMHAAVAQVIEVPTVAVGPQTGVHWSLTFQSVSVAGGPDGGFAVAWRAHHYSGAKVDERWALVTEAFNADATPRRAADRFESRSPNLASTGLASFAAGYAVAFESGESFGDMHMRSQFLALDGTPLNQADVSEAAIGVSMPRVAGMSTGSVFVWVRRPENVVTAALFNQQRQPRATVDVAVDQAGRFDVAGTYDGGFVVAFEADGNPKARFLDANAVAQGPVLELGVPGLVTRIAASPAGDVVALALMRGTNELWIQRIDSTGATLGAATLVHSGGSVLPDLAFDRNGNLYVVWYPFGEPRR